MDELQKLAKDALGIAAQTIIEQLNNSKLHPYLKKSTNQADLVNGTYEEFVRHPEMEFKLNGLEAADEMQINSVTQQATKPNPEKNKLTCHHCKKRGHYRNQCRQLKKQRKKRHQQN